MHRVHKVHMRNAPGIFAAPLALALLLAAGVMVLWSSVSLAGPPPLAASHARFDNPEGCVKCHDADDYSKVPSGKCLSCHKGIAVRIRSGRGYHAKVGGACAKCHRDHRGRGATMIAFNPASFNHDQAGWPLQGAHKDVRCQKCHTGTRPGGRVRTYLGANANCSSCHANIHGFSRGSLKKCDRCHNVFGWGRINANTNFSHNAETRYKLDGGHVGVSCQKCHKGKARFAPTPHADCKNCHNDEHRGLFARWACKNCHNTKKFKSVSFGHNVPRFKLTGKHKGVSCNKCHVNRNWAPPWKPASNRCNNCHAKDNKHGTQFEGQLCNNCHSPAGWRRLNFSHNKQSRFRLVGKHEQVDCKKCHNGGRYKPLPMECKSCHAQDDPHKGKFGDKPCANCHTPKDWLKVKFDHSVTRFQLTGAHQDTDCEKCHPGGDLKATIPSSCDGCHIDLHGGQFKEKLCGNCHGMDAWPIDNFAHNDQARFKLVGKHMEVDCDNCHLQGHFKPIQANCSTCHADFHQGQMANKVCEQCHSPLGWQDLNFVHNRDSDYKLRGQHVTLDCKKCHTDNNYRGLENRCADCHTDIHRGTKGARCEDCHNEIAWDTNTAQVHFFGAYELSGEHDRLPCERCHTGEQELGGLGHECANCHRDPHFSSFGPFCVDCHTQDAWLPSKFRHFQTGFRLTGQHRFVNCDRCHVNRIYGGLPTQCEFCHTDTVQRVVQSPRIGEKHSCFVAGCGDCHSTIGWAQIRAQFRDATCIGP